MHRPPLWLHDGCFHTRMIGPYGNQHGSGIMCFACGEKLSFKGNDGTTRHFVGHVNIVCVPNGPQAAETVLLVSAEGRLLMMVLARTSSERMKTRGPSCPPRHDASQRQIVTRVRRGLQSAGGRSLGYRRGELVGLGA